MQNELRTALPTNEERKAAGRALTLPTNSVLRALVNAFVAKIGTLPFEDNDRDADLGNNTNAQHLIVTTASNGLDWHPQDVKPIVGTVTEFNIHYYAALHDGAQLAIANTGAI